MEEIITLQSISLQCISYIISYHISFLFHSFGHVNIHEKETLPSKLENP